MNILSEILKKYTHLNWDYLNISNKAIESRYDWVNISLPSINTINSSSHENDMKRFFLFIRTFSNKKEAILWMTTNSINFLPIHLELLDLFCNSNIQNSSSIDELIDATDDKILLYFIQNTLERSLLWNNPDPCWPSDFNSILQKSNEYLMCDFTKIKKQKNSKIEGMNLVSSENYTHVFYKFQNLINGIQEGEIYYDIKYLAKQSHESLIKSMELFFEYRISSLRMIKWERKIKETAIIETNWCKNLFKKDYYFNYAE